MRFFAENHPEQISEPRANPIFGSMGAWGLANAAKKGNIDALEFLLNWTSPEGERIADRVSNWKGNYSFLGLGNFASGEAVAVALRAGADPNEMQTIAGAASALCATSRGLQNVGVAKHNFLVKLFAMMEGARPLHWAAANGNVGVAEELLKGGADPRVRNAHGATPLMIAEQSGQVRIAGMLRAELELWPAPVRAPGLCAAETLPEATPDLIRRIRREHAKKVVQRPSLASTVDDEAASTASTFSGAPAEMWV